MIFVSCRNVCDKTLVREFESILGKQETIYLNEIINDFDSFLNANYSEGNEYEKYSQFL